MLAVRQAVIGEVHDEGILLHLVALEGIHYHPNTVVDHGVLRGDVGPARGRGAWCCHNTRARLPTGCPRR